MSDSLKQERMPYIKLLEEENNKLRAELGDNGNMIMTLSLRLTKVCKERDDWKELCGEWRDACYHYANWDGCVPIEPEHDFPPEKPEGGDQW